MGQCILHGGPKNVDVWVWFLTDISLHVARASEVSLPELLAQESGLVSHGFPYNERTGNDAWD